MTDSEKWKAERQRQALTDLDIYVEMTLVLSRLRDLHERATSKEAKTALRAIIAVADQVTVALFHLTH